MLSNKLIIIHLVHIIVLLLTYLVYDIIHTIVIVIYVNHRGANCYNDAKHDEPQTNNKLITFFNSVLIFDIKIKYFQFSSVK